jgi:hypothetical protein
MTQKKLPVKAALYLGLPLTDNPKLQPKKLFFIFPKNKKKIIFFLI